MCILYVCVYVRVFVEQQVLNDLKNLRKTCFCVRLKLVIQHNTTNERTNDIIIKYQRIPNKIPQLPSCTHKQLGFENNTTKTKNKNYKKFCYARQTKRK